MILQFAAPLPLEIGDKKTRTRFALFPVLLADRPMRTYVWLGRYSVEFEAQQVKSLRFGLLSPASRIVWVPVRNVTYRPSYGGRRFWLFWKAPILSRRPYPRPLKADE